MRTEKIIYKLYADIIPVKGYSRCLLLDITKKRYWYIPTVLYEVVSSEIDFESLQALYPDEKEVTRAYKKFLLKNDLIFQISGDEKDAFPPINMRWHNPGRITNMIIDIDSETSLDSIENIYAEIGKLGVEAILFRCFSEKKLKELKKHIIRIGNDPCNRLRDIQLDVCIRKTAHLRTTRADIKAISKLPVISTITVFTADKNPTDHPVKDDKIRYVRRVVEGPEYCGTIQGNIDSINLELISESMHYNSCLNCKLSIDSAGNIKNCPSMTRNFGNISDTTLEKALNRKDFKQYWNLTKDSIEGCKDCEFRYICTDCRAYTNRTHTDEKGLDISKPLKCGYDPYTGKWEEWSTNPLKQKAIRYYGMEKFI